MILVISQNKDLSTDKVFEWLLEFGFKDVVRINEDDSLSILNFNIKEAVCKIKLKDRIIDFSDVRFFWFRRGNIHKRIKVKEELINSKIGTQLTAFLDSEWNISRQFILNRLQEKKSLGNSCKIKVSKLENLLKAYQCGLCIPDTIVSDCNKILHDFTKKSLSITKPISEVTDIMYLNQYIDLSTKRIGQFISKQNLRFSSLLQNEIEKWFELRVFINYREIFAMAIFSQNNETTKLDYRNYDREKMNRKVPYLLPRKIQKKILLLMDECGLDTGSIDLIVTPNKEYIFLEVNPTGNIEMVSEACNYYCEKSIAESILKKMKE